MLYRTDNAGTDWRIAIDGVANPDRFHYYAMATGVDGRLYLSGEAGLLYYSADTGQSWVRIEDLYDGSLFGSVEALTDGRALMVGSGGLVLASDAEGNRQAWRHPSRASLSSAVQAANGDIWLVGMKGLMALSEAKPL